MEARQLLRLLDLVKHYQTKEPKEILGQMSDEQFKVAFWAVADLFKQMKNDAIRRGLWEELTTKRS